MTLLLQAIGVFVLPLLIIASLRVLTDMVRDGTTNVRSHRQRQSELATLREGFRKALLRRCAKPSRTTTMSEDRAEGLDHGGVTDLVSWIEGQQSLGKRQLIHEDPRMQMGIENKLNKLERIRRALIALAKAERDALSLTPGWKLVPVEPTKAMVNAGDGKDPGFGSLSADIYRAMLDAAPSVGVG